MASDPPQTSATATAATTAAAPSPPTSSAATSTATRSFTNPPATKVTTPIPHTQQLHNQNQPIPNLSLRPPNPSSTNQLPKPHDPPQALLYPVASSGRGFVRPQSSDQAVSVAKTGGYPPLPVFSIAHAGRAHPDPTGLPLHMMRPPHAHYHHHPAVSASAQIKGFPVSAHPKVASSPSSAPDCNGYRNIRDRGRDDSFAVVRERKVRISDGSSLYAMCRSWLKNGFHEETQLQYIDGVKSLPRPLPIPMADANLAERNEDGEEEEENEESTEQLSAQDLLKKHIKRAKRVRSRLREERLQRIARYKTRLALLLPPPVEQFRTDAAAGN